MVIIVIEEDLMLLSTASVFPVIRRLVTSQISLRRRDAFDLANSMRLMCRIVFENFFNVLNVLTSSPEIVYKRRWL